MRFEKLTQRLKQYNRSRQRQLSLYIHSPWFGVPAGAIALFDYLQQQHRSFPQKNLLPDVLKKAIPSLPSKSAQDTAATRLLHALDAFEAQCVYNQHPYHSALCRLQSLRQNKQPAAFEKQASLLRKRIQKSPHSDINDWEALHRLSELEQTGFDAKINRQQLGNITQVLHTLDVFYALKKIRYQCELIQRQKWANIQAVEQSSLPLLQILEPYNRPDYPYIYLFIQVYTLLTSSTFTLHHPAYAFLSQYLLKQNSKNLSTTHLEVLDYLIAWCIRHVNKGNKQAATQYLQWIQLKEKHQGLMQGGQLLPVTYQNIAAAAMYSGQQAGWLQQFAQKYRPLLPDDVQEINYTYVQALVCYLEKKYAEAAHLFSHIKHPTDIVMNIRAKRWYFICCYHYWSEPHQLDSLLDTFRKYVARHKNRLKTAEAPTLLFINYSRQLLKATSAAHKQKLSHRLQNETFFPGKEWLEEQCTPHKNPGKVQ